MQIIMVLTPYWVTVQVRKHTWPLSPVLVTGQVLNKNFQLLLRDHHTPSLFSRKNKNQKHNMKTPRPPKLQGAVVEIMVVFWPQLQLKISALSQRTSEAALRKQRLATSLDIPDVILGRAASRSLRPNCFDLLLTPFKQWFPTLFWLLKIRDQFFSSPFNDCRNRLFYFCLSWFLHYILYLVLYISGKSRIRIKETKTEHKWRKITL